MVEEAKKEVVKLLYELNSSEVIYPLRIAGQTIYAHMKRYQPFDMKELLKARALRMAQGEDDSTELKSAGRMEESMFFWMHFIKLSGPGMRLPDGVTGTSEFGKEFIQANPRFGIQGTVVSGGFGGLKAQDPAEGAVSLLSLDPAVTVFQDLYNPDLNKIVRYTMKHCMRAETEKDTRDHDNARGNLLVHSRKRESVRLVNYDSLEILYNSLIEQIDGACIDGAPCTLENKDAWVKEVPLWHKDFVLQEFFRGAQVKNVI